MSAARKSLGGGVPKLISKSYHKLINWVNLCAIYKLSFSIYADLFVNLPCKK